MTEEEKLSMFSKELSMITEDNVRKFTETLLKNTGDWFYHEPASTSGKYHPQFSLGDGGLARHTKALIYFLNEFIATDMFGVIDEHHKNLLILSGIAHDIRKHDEQGQYLKAHPKYAAQFIRETYAVNDFGLSNDDLTYIINAVRSHMGKWDKPKPKRGYEKLLHLADYTASRKEIIMNF